MTDNPLLKVEGLKKVYTIGGGFLGRPPVRIKAVDGVDLSINKNETLGLVGESGCGKTTLGRCILRLEEPTEGRVTLEGRDLGQLSRQEMRKIRREMQIIFQDPYSSLNPRKNVERLITESLKIHQLADRRERRERLKELLDMVGLRPEAGSRYPHEFSGGQRQRICVARALALNPKLIVARRTGFGPGRLHPGPGAEPAGGSAKQTGVDLSFHLPRPERGAPFLRPGGGHVHGPHSGNSPRSRPV